MGQLSSKRVATRTALRREKVYLPTFDDPPVPGETEEEAEKRKTWTWVYEITAANKQILSMYAKKGYLNASMSIIAALTAKDASGNLAFGATPEGAIQMVLSLPEEYNIELARIAMKAMELSGKVDETGQRTLSDEEMLEEAKKNSATILA